MDHRSQTLELPGDGRTAIVRIPSLGEDPAFAPFLATTFATLKSRHVQRLVLDLRADQGGEDLNGVLVYAYLSAVPFRYYAHLVANHAQFTSARGDASFPADRFRARLVPTADGRFEVRPDAHPGLQLRSPRPITSMAPSSSSWMG